MAAFEPSGVIEALADWLPRAVEPRLVAAMAGVALLTAGRRLFWLAIGALGFLVVYRAAGEILTLQEHWRLALSVSLGVVGAVAAVGLQKLAVVVVGVALGAGAVFWLAGELGMGPGWPLWAAMAGVALVGGLVASRVFEVALAIFTSLAGAILVLDAMHLSGPLGAAGLPLLTVLGTLLQLSSSRRRRSPDD